MEKDKNLAEEAFIQMKNVEGIIAENAKGILASTMKEEINQLVKESLSEQEDEIETDTEIDMDSDDEMEMDSDDEMDFEDDMDMDSDDEMEMDSDDEMEMDFEDDMESDLTPIDLTGASDEEVLKVFKSMSDEDGIIVKKEDEGIYLTDDDTDSEYFVKMNESEDLHSEMYEEDYDDEEIDKIIDEIFQESMDEEMHEEMDEVVYEIEMDEDEDEMEFEYDIDMESEDEDFEPEWVDVKDLYGKKDSYDDKYDMEMDFEDDMEMEYDDDMEYDDEDVDFFSKERFVSQEQFLREAKKSVKGKGVKGNGPKFSYKDGKKGFNEKKKEGPKTMGTGKPKFNFKEGENLDGEFKPVKKKSETKEAARTLGMGSKFRKGGLPKPRAHSKFNTAIKENVNEEVAVLRQKNDEYRKALNVFRNKLNEVAIFNSNLAYATRLFTEHSTTKKEKINILRRFDNVETLKESKNLYKAIKDELSKGENKPINESVETKINKQISTGSSMNLIESKTYENPQFLRMKDLMNKIG
jgi:hypothetical protein